MAKQWINISIIPVFYAQIIFSRFLYSIWKTILCISKTALSAYRESCTWHDNVALFQLVLGRRLHSTTNVRWLGVAKKSSPNFRSACCKIFLNILFFIIRHWLPSPWFQKQNTQHFWEPSQWSELILACMSIFAYYYTNIVYNWTLSFIKVIPL